MDIHARTHTHMSINYVPAKEESRRLLRGVGSGCCSCFFINREYFYIFIDIG